MRTYVLDASALFAFLRDTPGASKVDELLREAMHGRARVLMSGVNYGEVYGKILREPRVGARPHNHAGGESVSNRLLDATPQRACQAADIKVKHKLYYADSFAAALAIEHKATLVTSDSDFRKLGRGFPSFG